MFGRKSKGTECPNRHISRNGGSRRDSTWSRSRTQATGAGPWSTARRRPIPRASTRPRIAGAASAMTEVSERRNTTLSSDTSPAPSAMRSSARADLPLPDAPTINNARPSRATQEACTLASSPVLQFARVGDAIDQTGRPTTKRAPSGSEVTSASVGRMFSAQITPPCASTICLEIARPRPELFPKCSSGRWE